MVHTDSTSGIMAKKAQSFKNHFPAAQFEKFLTDLESQGDKPRQINYPYDYIQDLALFANDGTLHLNAQLPIDEDILVDLTFGIGGTGDWGMHLKRLDPQHAKQMNLPFVQMKLAFVEGGGLITGQLKNGTPYAIITYAPYERAKLTIESEGREANKENILTILAQDFAVKKDNLLLVPFSGHIDLIMQALPGGKILLHDPLQVLTILKTLQPNEKIIEMMDFYRPNEWEIKNLNKIAEILSKKLVVSRVAGIFKQPSGQHFYQTDRINFFNGFLGKNPAGNTFVFTNKGNGISQLEKYWRNLLVSKGIKRNNIHFHGNYNSGAGLDCLGAPSGSKIY